MEMNFWFYAAFFALTATTLWLLLRQRRLRKEIYEYTDRLEQMLNDLLKEKPIQAETIGDDLLGKTQSKLKRLSDMYSHKNREIHEEKEKLKELVSDISHQVRTPMTNIRLYLEKLEAEYDSGKERDILHKMDGQIDKLDFLFQSMIKISRLETGTIRIQKTDAPMSETLADAISTVIPKAEKKQIGLSIDYDDKLRVCHDRKWTAEALYNLLDNAVKYMPVGGSVKITVKKGTAFVQIMVSDTGKGIAVERQGAVFARFYREPEVHDQEGIGIGLYLARKIVQMQGGYMELQAEVGKGSTFTINLPIE